MNNTFHFEYFFGDGKLSYGSKITDCLSYNFPVGDVIFFHWQKWHRYFLVKFDLVNDVGETSTAMLVAGTFQESVLISLMQKI